MVWGKRETKGVRKGEATEDLREPNYHVSCLSAPLLLPRIHFPEHLSTAELRSHTSAEAVLLKG